MKKKFYFATLVIAALSFTGCANDEYVGDQQKHGEQNGAIAFSTKSTNTVRADNLTVGETAAGKLHNQFWVYGWKTVEGSASTPQPVFINYKVEYGLPNTYPSDTKVWEYVGKGPNVDQTIKYWDYSAVQYDFEAYSINGDGTVTRIANNDQSGNGLAEGDYEVKGISQNGCANLYFAEKNTVSKSDYNKAVTLSFKSVLSKIRVGFYETIPGYSVKITKFYGSNGNANGWGSGDGQKFVAWCPNKKIDNTNKSFVVQYETATPAVTKVQKGDTYQPISSAPSTGGYTLDKDLTLGGNLIREISTKTSAVTWDQSNGEYTYFIPQNAAALCDGDEKQVKEMKIKVDYTLTSTDGSDEVINVTGATAIVPAEYLRWKPNTAYSYVFKISDNTNGSTGGEGGTEGLYPITFDAVVEDYANEGSITTVSTPSVTAKQEGTTDGYVTTDGIVFKTGKTINLKVMNGNADVTSNASITGDYITNYDYNKTPEKNLIDQSKVITKDQSTSLTVQDSAGSGYWVLKVATSSDSDAAFTYVIIRVGSAEEGPANPANQ